MSRFSDGSSRFGASGGHLRLMTPRACTLSALVALLLLGGCDRPCVEPVDSEQGQLGFDDPFFVGLPTAYVSGDPVVEGSAFCPDVRQWYEGPERTCVAISAAPVMSGYRPGGSAVRGSLARVTAGTGS